MMTTKASSPVQARIMAALRGAFCADAASMGTHWTYDPEEMKKVVPSIEAPEFKLDPPTPKFYDSDEFPGHYGPGMLSPYGEQMLFITEYISKAEARPLEGSTLSKSMLEWATSFGGRPDTALKTFIDNMNKEDGSGQWPNCGADDQQAHIYMKIVPVVCCYAGQTNLLDQVETCVRVHQNNDNAVAFAKVAARILEAILLGGNDLGDIITTCETNLAQDDDIAEKEVVLKAFADAKKLISSTDPKYPDLDSALLDLSHEMMKDQPDSMFYNLAARSCMLPGSFIGPLFLFLKASSGRYGDDKSTWYEQALRENILASGDTCSRAVFIGAVLAGIAEQVPETWTSRMHKDALSAVDKAGEAISMLDG